MELVQGHSARKSQALNAGTLAQGCYTMLSLRELGRVQDSKKHRAQRTGDACFI